MLASLVKIALAVAIGVPLLAWLFQERMIFFPRPVESRPTPRPNVEDVALAAADGVKLRGWLVRGAGTTAPLVIYFGGNAEEVSWLTEVADQFSGWSLLLVNFRGYGESEGKPGEKELLQDGLAIYDYVKRRPDVIPERIVAMGRSLGSGVAVHLAAHRPLRGVILVSPYDSIVEVAKRHYPFLPVSLLLRHRFDSLALAPQVDAPLLCLVATEDRVVPIPHSRALFEAWRGAKTWREVPRAGHDSIS
ncbi:MAG TPA: alpha/beta hydrolase, partial [Burkholderiales bacterium]|nr:alpha/beta hydrolase [Burkholderiales bacterium]